MYDIDETSWLIGTTAVMDGCGTTRPPEGGGSVVEEQEVDEVEEVLI